MQEGHGDWDDSLLNNLSDVGTVQSVLDNGDIRVKYSGSRIYTLNHNAVTKVTCFSTGDIVQVIDDIAAVHSFQENHGGWVDDMALSLGQVGRVVKVFPTGDVRVVVNSRTWTYNPRCLSHAPLKEIAEDESGDLEEEGGDLSLNLKLLSVLDNPAIVVAAAASGDVGTLREFLARHPSQVNTKAGGKAAIHCACAQGNVEVLKCLLEFSPDIEITDEDGDRPMHLSAYSDEDEVAQLLIAANVDVNSKNNKGATPLIIAAVKGHHSVLRILANNPNTNLHDQDTDGDTALHCAVLAQKNESVNMLLEAGADPTLLNFRLFTPIHEAARIGFLSAVDNFIRRYPSHVGIRKEDGYTPLHLAALNDHLDVVASFIEHELCDINCCTNENQTPLHLAVHQSHSDVVERLIGYGANLNIQDLSGDTPLHIALVTTSAGILASNTPQLVKVQDELKNGHENVAVGVITACFLVQEGADVYIQNIKGHTPLQLSPPNIITIVMKYVDRTSSFHGSMKSPTPGCGLLTQDQKTTPFLTEQMSDKKVCFLCEASVDVKFEPCGHALMCRNCADRAKKCPLCKKPVKTVYKLKEMCIMCHEEEGSVTVKPCGHIYCQECCKRLKVCFECRSPIARKEGLEPEHKDSAAQSSSPNKETQPSCAICLTEPRNTALQCGHLLCWECAQKVDNCPVCRKFVSHRIRLFQ
ncbi:E3 ubiquitin-protein ligase mib1 [Geodia barretti]|nr:E3 ubiquitin-protein ligase mib1 [Geodia barretti]